MNKNYWHMNLHPTGEQGSDDDIRNRVLSHTIGMGIDFESVQENDFQNNMNIGDVVLVLNGRTPIALVEVIGERYEYTIDSNSIVWYQARRAVKILGISGEGGNGYFPKDDYKIARTNPGTLKRSTDTNCETYKCIDSLYKCCTKK